ncbi:MAG: hypothetical protein F4123_10950 [Gemmatimonadetes bacterium]|nr:hypothetical protein [Gemmatimonadota bacterium]MYC00101.1 hypothetical protein [Gemmatimonadota bacterium]MYI46876.1 hypothetical protein [Gemmatimonadota bacterium]
MLVLTGRAATQDGGPDRAGLQARGPLLQVALSVLDQQADILSSRGEALGVNIREQGIIALIGRDILSSCILIYNGVEAQYTLAF